MRKTLTLLATITATGMMLSACGTPAQESSPSASNTDVQSTTATTDDGVTKVVVGASPVPHAQILEFVSENLAAEAGIELEIVEYTDYVLPNEALASGDLDVNFFQHLPYLEQQIAEKGFEFTPGEGVHIEPFGAFSSKYQDISELPDGATIAITNDVSNQARGLKLLAEAGLLNDITDDSAALTLTDEQNPRGFKFVENQPELIVQQINDPAIDLAFVNGNFILTAGLKSEDALLLEKVAGNPYANMLVWRTDNTNPGVAKLEELLHSGEVRSFIKETWPAGNVTPSE